MLRVYIFCIPNSATGGIELLHQLCNSMNNNPECEAIMYYHIPGKELIDPVPEIYKRYGCSYVINGFVSPDDVDKAFFVVPEIRTYIFDEGKIFSKTKHRCIFWESVDNYFLTTPAGSMFGFLSDKSMLHLAQSEYSRQFLVDMGVSEKMILDVSDYLSAEYIENQGVLEAEHHRQDTVLYNPKKGLKYTQKIKDVLRDISFVPIENMSPDQVRELMFSSKVYIDFGEHPGKDRIPREAAMSGLIVITGKNGSAANPIDIAIPEEFKFERNDDNIPAITEKIRKSLSNYVEYTKLFDNYRDSIRKEPQVFEKQVRHAVEVMNEIILRPVNIFVVGHKDFVCPESEEYISFNVGGTSGKRNTDESIVDFADYSIAQKSRLYHEIAALHSIWKKNLVGNESDILGLNQYKRFLCTPDGSSLLNSYACNYILDNYDIILPQMTRINASREVLFTARYGSKKDLDMIRGILSERYPRLVEKYESTIKKSEGHYYNLFITSRKVLNDYCGWLFDILFEFEKRSTVSKLSDGIMSHIAEILMDVYITDKALKIAEVPLCNSEWK